jgi:hypothetical protein
MPDERREPRFSSTDAVEVVEYPRVHRAAVAALLLGLVSWAALTSPVLWFLPLIGVVMATLALRSMTRSPEVVLGRRAAIIGLALCVIFISWASTHYFIRQELLYRQAREHGEYWLQLVRDGRLREAHQLTMSKGERQSPDTDLEEYYLDKPQLIETYESFCNDSPMNQVVALDGKGSLRFVGRVKIETDRPMGSIIDLVTLQWAIDVADGDQTRSIPIVLGVGKTRMPNTPEAFWFIRGMSDLSSLKD